MMMPVDSGIEWVKPKKRILRLAVKGRDLSLASTIFILRGARWGNST